VTAAATTEETDRAKLVKERLAKLQDSVRTGGKGSVRRKKKAVHKVNATDDKRLQTTLKRLAVNVIPGIEEVNLFKEDGNVIQFKNPKVQASITANTYVVSGTPADKKMEELLPEMLQSFNPEQLNSLKQMLAQQNAAGEKPVNPAAEDDDVPPLVGTFEDAAKAPSTTDTKPAETTPAAAGESKPVETIKPAEPTKPAAEAAKPVEAAKSAVPTKPAETTKPVETKPAEPVKPAETKPAETKPAEPAKPVDAKATKPAETKPAEPAKPVDAKATKPAETKPVEPAKPVDAKTTKPAETKPVEPAKPADKTTTSKAPAEAAKTATSDSKPGDKATTK